VDRVLAEPVAEAEEQQDSLVLMQLRHVLAGLLNSERRRDTVPRENLVLLQVDVYGVSPIPGGVEQDPVLDTVLLHSKAEVVAIHELAVDRPLAVQPIELERPRDPGSRGRVRKLVVRDMVDVRICGSIADGIAAHPELQQEIASSGRHDVGEQVSESVAALDLTGDQTLRGYRPHPVDLSEAV